MKKGTLAINPIEPPAIFADPLDLDEQPEPNPSKAAQLTADQVDPMREAFAAIDADGNGTIDKEELTNLLKEQGQTDE
jgi:Ca2+-binding EF-hand superfamily protein